MTHRETKSHVILFNTLKISATTRSTKKSLTVRFFSYLVTRWNHTRDLSIIVVAKCQMKWIRIIKKNNDLIVITIKQSRRCEPVNFVVECLKMWKSEMDMLNCVSHIFFCIYCNLIIYQHQHVRKKLQIQNNDLLDVVIHMFPIYYSFSSLTCVFRKSKYIYRSFMYGRMKIVSRNMESLIKKLTQNRIIIRCYYKAQKKKTLQFFFGTTTAQSF